MTTPGVPLVVHFKDANTGKRVMSLPVVAIDGNRALLVLFQDKLISQFQAPQGLQLDGVDYVNEPHKATKASKAKETEVSG